LYIVIRAPVVDDIRFFYIVLYYIYDPAPLTIYILCFHSSQYIIICESNNNAYNIITVSRCTFSALRSEKYVFGSYFILHKTRDRVFSPLILLLQRVRFVLSPRRRPNIRVQQRITTKYKIVVALTEDFYKSKLHTYPTYEVLIL